MLLVLLVSLSAVMAVYAAYLLKAALAKKAAPRPEALVLGAVTNFFDTLGIGSFAPTMAWLKLRKLVPDKLIPCTLVAGHTPPAMMQGVIFLALLGVSVDPVLLIGCIVAVLLGGILGAPLVVRSKVWLVQMIVGLALLMAGGFYALTNLGLMPGGGTANSLPLVLMIVAIGANFIFGVLLNFGVGNYAPTLAMLSLMGMDPRLSFPIMAAGAGFAGAAIGTRHISMGHIDLRIATGIAIGGIPAVLIAAFVVKDMPVTWLRWLVFAVVIYAALVMLRAAAQGYRAVPAPAPVPIN
ncbi:MAG: permease [Caulobacteraceae bacterium]